MKRSGTVRCEGVKLPLLVLALSLSLLGSSCSKEIDSDSDRAHGDPDKKSKRELAQRSDPDSKPEAAGEEPENDEVPDAGDIGEDCVQFLRATTAASTEKADGTCPTCPTGDAGPEVLKMGDLNVDRVTPAGATCQVYVTVRATFNPSHGGTIVGGLTAWMSPEQREKYAGGETPSGQQTYKIQITYRRNTYGWQPIEFAPLR